MIVDVHAHTVPAGVQRWLEEHRSIDLILHPGMAPPGTPLSEGSEHLAGRLRMMDEAAVDQQILSLAPIEAVLDEHEAVSICQAANDAHRTMVETHPDRFRAYLSLPLPHLEASLAELDRGFDRLGFMAVMVQCSYGTTSVADERFEELFKAMDRRGAVLLIHPSVTGLCTPLITNYRLSPSVGPVVEDTVIVGQLLIRQIPARFPNLKIIVPHLGGGLAMCAQRLDNQMSRVFRDLEERPLQSMRRLWYDTVVHGSNAALRCAVEVFGSDRIVSGSDYPFMQHYGPYGDAFKFLGKADLSAQDSAAILRGNARSLFGIERPVTD